MGIQGSCVTTDEIEAYVQRQKRITNMPKSWHHACPDEINAYTQRLQKHLPIRSEKKMERYHLTASIRYMVLANNAKSNNGKCRCELCGRTKDDGVIFHVDHIRPIAKGGKTEPQNLQVLCSECNLGKNVIMI